MKKRLAIILCLSVAMLLFGCTSAGYTQMPFNGDIQFHDITLTVPDSFIRDSAGSDEDLWAFEKGMYSQIILVSRSDLSSKPAAALESYVAYMQSVGAESELTTFRGNDAVLSKYEKDGKYCQEILFNHNGSTYAVALRGGTEAEFQTLVDTVELTVPESVV